MNCREENKDGKENKNKSRNAFAFANGFFKTAAI